MLDAATCPMWEGHQGKVVGIFKPKWANKGKKLQLGGLDCILSQIFCGKKTGDMVVAAWEGFGTHSEGDVIIVVTQKWSLLART